MEGKATWGEKVSETFIPPLGDLPLPGRVSRIECYHFCRGFSAAVRAVKVRIIAHQGEVVFLGAETNEKSVRANC